MDPINILKTIQLPEPMTGDLASTFKDINSNFNALSKSTYTAGKDGVTRVHTLKFKDGKVDNGDKFKDWLTSQLGISNPDVVVNSIVNAFASYKKDDDWYANGSYEIYIGTDGNIKEALPILYTNDKTISYLGFEYEDSSLILKPKQGTVLGIDDGYWVINGIKTDIKAEGVAGENGKDGLAVEFGFVTVEPVEFSTSILKIIQYWDYTIPNNTPMSFDNDLDAKGKDDWFDKNKNRVFLFTHETKTYMGYVTKYTHDYNSNIPESEPIYGFYYSDATMYSPGAGGSGVSGLITALDNMVYNQQVGDKPRGIWFKKTEDERDKEAIFMYNNDNTLNICKIDDYTKAYNTGDIKGESTTVKVNGDFECGGVTITKDTTTSNYITTIKGNAKIEGSTHVNIATINKATINDANISNITIKDAITNGNTTLNGHTTISNASISNATINDATISNNLRVGNNIITSTIECKESTNNGALKFDGYNLDFRKTYGTFDDPTDNKTKTWLDIAGIYTYTSDKNDVNLELYNGDKYLRVGRTMPDYDKEDENAIIGSISKYTTITPTKITSSNLKLIGNATINGRVSFADGSFVLDNNSLIYGNTYWDETTQSYKISDERVSILKSGKDNDSLNLKSGDRYLLINSKHNNIDKITGIYPGAISISSAGQVTTIKANDITPGAIIDGNVLINGSLTATSIFSGESAGDVTGDVTFNNLTVSNRATIDNVEITDANITNATINDLKVFSNNISNIDSYIDVDNSFKYPKLIYDVLYKLGIIHSTSTPYSLNLTKGKIYQTNYCNLYIKSCDTALFYSYIDTDIDNNITDVVYSVGVDTSSFENNPPIIGGYNCKGNRYRITGYIMLNDYNSGNISFGKVTQNKDVGGNNYNIFESNNTTTIPQIIYIDDYFVFVYSNYNHKIITPYGILNSKFVPHHKSTRDNIGAYSYDLTTMYSTIGGNDSIAKQSVIHTLGDDLKFKLIYNITTNS